MTDLFAPTSFIQTAATRCERDEIVQGDLLSELTFKDRELQTCIEVTAKINRWQYIEQFTALTCHKSDLYWLEGIEQLSQLRSLELKSDILDRFTAIASLTNLTHLTIDAYQFDDFLVLRDMQQLTHLAIRSHMPLGDRNSLQQLPHLVYVDLA